MGRQAVIGREKADLELQVLRQPDDFTCGATCLHAVYRYWGERISLDRVIAEVTPLEEGGTLGVFLACDALRRGFDARIYTYNLNLFDPSWFKRHVDLPGRLREQQRFKRDSKLALETEAFLEFFELGGTLHQDELSGALIRSFLAEGVPVLTGLSATYLYGCPREYGHEYDDVRGRPVGHFVVLSGYDRASREVMVADPLGDNPRFGAQYYRVRMDRLIASILLGIVTYDANLIVITPRDPTDSE
jgi:hypothetical protein